ncbi:MAG: hypothetical protein VYD94_04490, partial [Thermoproteota archaeon]|nr:hypothetical protein [Thermoproteota archaeon]
MSSMDVVVNAGGSVDVSSVEGVHVSGSDVSVSSSVSMDVSSRDVSVVAGDRLDAYGGEEVRVTGGSIGVESLGRLDGVSAGGVSLTTEDAVMRAPGSAEAYVGSGVIGASSSLAVHAGSSLGVSTGLLSVSVEGDVEAVSGGEMSLRAETLSIESPELTVSDSFAGLSTGDGVLRASGGVEGYVSEGLSVSAGGMWLRSGDSLSVSSVSSARVVSGGRVVADAGEGMSVSAGEDLSVSAGVVSVSSTGSVGVVGSTVSVESSGSLRALGVDSVSVESSGGVSVSSVGALTGVSGSSSSFVSGGDVSVSGGEGVSGVFGEGAELTASAVRVSSSSVLEASTAGSVSVSGSEGVSVSSGGSLVRLSPEGEGEFVGFVWESARSFDSFENVVSPSVSEVEELVIVSGAGPYARGASEVSIDLYDGSSWVSVWSASLGAEAYYSLGGLSVRFASQSVSGVRVRSAPGLNPTFEGWSDVVIHFGRRSSGSVSVSSAWRIEASAGEEVSVSSMDVVVNAGGSVDVSSVEGVHVSGSDVSVS